VKLTENYNGIQNTATVAFGQGGSPELFRFKMQKLHSDDKSFGIAHLKYPYQKIP
jgi:hypothetical protein